MAESVIRYGEFMMDQIDVVNVAQLDFAHGKVGQKYPLLNDEQKTEFARNEAQHILPLTKPNTADCGDERITIAMADGVNDRSELDARIVPQLFGGIGLATTKAMIAADAVALRDAKNVTEAYLIVSELLSQMGEEDAGHSDCGASKSVESSVASEIERSILIPSIGLFVPDDGGNGLLIDKNSATKRARLEAGFYGGWDPANHQQYLIVRFSQNFSYIDVDLNDEETHGHNGSGVLIVTHDGYGYQKTGKAFSVTLPKMRELAYKTGGSDEERRRILLGFADDTLHVGGGLVTTGFPVFAQA